MKLKASYLLFFLPAFVALAAAAFTFAVVLLAQNLEALVEAARSTPGLR